MNARETKKLKQKLIDQQNGKRGTPDIPKKLAGEIATITRVKGEQQAAKELPTIADVFISRKKTYDDYEYDRVRQNIFKSEAGMPGFKSFSNLRKWTTKYNIKAAKVAVILLLIVQTCFCQHRDPCARTFSQAGTVWGGTNKNGATAGMEFGLWGVDQPLGVSAGFLVANEPVTNIMDGKEQVENQVVLDLILRVTAKVYQNPAGTMFHVITGYGAIFGNAGISYRVYKTIGTYGLIGLEPTYSYKYGGGVNALLTFVFR